MANEKKQTFTYDMWLRDPKDPTKDVHITVEPKVVEARTSDGARLVAAREIPQEYSDRLEDVEITVRPF